MDKIIKIINDVCIKAYKKFQKHGKLIKFLGKAVSIVTVAYVIYAAYTVVKKLDKALITVDLILPLLIILAITTSAIFIYSFSYYFILKEQSQQNIGIMEVIYMYGTSNIYKYLPSNMMHYVGRNVLAQKYKIEQKKVLVATILEMTNIVAVTIAICLFNYLFFVKQYIIAVLVVGVFILIAYKFKVMKSFLLLYMTTFINNVIVVYLYNFYNGSSPFNSMEQISIIQSLSWLAGFIVPGAPGGIGIKEFVMVRIGTEQFGAILPIVALLQRLVLIAGDFLAFFILQILNKTIGEKHGKE